MDNDRANVMIGTRRARERADSATVGFEKALWCFIPLVIIS
jgi:hypothetical protein